MHQLIDSFPPQNGNFTELILRHCRIQPWVTALVIPKHYDSRSVFQSDYISFGELGQRINALRKGLSARLNKGDSVVVMLKPSAELYAMVIALLAEGMVPVFIDTGMGIPKMLQALNESNASMIISVKSLLMARYIVPAFKNKLWVSVDGQGRDLINMDELIHYSLLMDSNQSRILPAEYIGHGDHGLISFTSGSTGKPKGADRTHDSLIQQHIAIREHWHEQSEDIDMTSLPVVVLHNLCCGMPSVIPAMNFSAPAKVSPCVVVEQIVKESVTRMTGAPAYFERLANWIIAHPVDMSCVRAVGIGGAPVSVKLGIKLREAFPTAEIRVIYGSTEAEPISSVPIESVITDQRKGYLIGCPGEHAEIKLVDLPDRPEAIVDKSLCSYEVQDGKPGELMVRGKHVLKGYVDNPEATLENKILLDDGSVWHRTGDLAKKDLVGRYWLLGRKSDSLLIQQNEENQVILNTYPVECEIDMLPSVYRSALIQVATPSGIMVSGLFYQPDKESNQHQWDTERQITKILIGAGLKEIEVFRISPMPVDSRHNSKINRQLLRKRLSRLKFGLFPMASSPSRRKG
jgi:acyl-CoA synthetase (AMP-forming)/AMP-acid ligase II